MPFTQQDLDNMAAAIATGATEVRFQDRTVRYQSAKDMLTFYNFMLGEMSGGAAGGGTSALGIIRQIRMTTNKGI